MGWDDDEFDFPAVVADASGEPPKVPLEVEAAEEEWCEPAATPAEKAPATEPRRIVIEDMRPLILVNLTALSDCKIHNRADPHACNDPTAKSALSKKIEASYAIYAGDATLIASGVVRPCAHSVWREALAELRRDQPGQYFAPVWPPANKTPGGR